MNGNSDVVQTIFLINNLFHFKNKFLSLGNQMIECFELADSVVINISSLQKVMVAYFQ